MSWRDLDPRRGTSTTAPVEGERTIDWALQRYVHLQFALSPRGRKTDKAEREDLKRELDRVEGVVETELTKLRDSFTHITDERARFLLDVFTTAMEGGIGYWSVSCAYHWTTDQNNALDNQDIRGFYAVVEGNGEDEDHMGPFIIDASVIDRGLKAIREGESGKLALHDNNRRTVIAAESMLDAGTHFDAEAADWVVQVGLFGEVVYS